MCVIAGGGKAPGEYHPKYISCVISLESLPIVSFLAW
jgi:hypothetical protein